MRGFLFYLPEICSMLFRKAEIEDLLWIVGVYNSTIASRASTADLEPVSVESRVEWFTQHQKRNRPLWIAEEHGVQVGWVSISDFKNREAYHITAEISIYIHENYRGTGMGKQILSEAIRNCRELGIKKLIGVIFSHNLTSIKLFSDAGFAEWGHLPEVTEMDGKPYSVKILGKEL